MRRRRRHWLAAIGAAAGLLLIGVGACGVASRHPASPVAAGPTTPLGKPTVAAPTEPSPASASASASGSAGPSGVLKASYGTGPAQPAQVAPPAWLTIPSLNVSKAKIVNLGLSHGQYPSNEDLPAGALDTFPLNAAPLEAGWYDLGARPGDVGPAIIAGHINYGSTPGIFAHLPDMRAGELVYVGLTNGTMVSFKVTKVGTSAKADFPTSSVYGPTGDPELRLIACSGDYDTATGHYLDNTIVYAAEVT